MDSSIRVLRRAPIALSGGGSPNLDGGFANSQYGGMRELESGLIDGGTA